VSSLADDARALMAATADVAGDKVNEARKRLASALENVKQAAGRVREKAVEGARLADECVREHPYQALVVGMAVGAVVGFVLGRRWTHHDD